MASFPMSYMILDVFSEQMTTPVTDNFIENNVKCPCACQYGQLILASTFYV